VWHALRNLAQAKDPRAGTASTDSRLNRRDRGALAGLLWAIMVTPSAIIFACAIGFEDARVCLQGAPSVEGRLVADTKDAILLTVELENGNEQSSASLQPSRPTALRSQPDIANGLYGNDPGRLNTHEPPHAAHASQLAL
jgi:hypothetical protein